MGKLTIKSGKGELVLEKSPELVGLKAAKKKDLSKADYVEKTHFQNLGGFQVVALRKEEGDVDKALDEVRRKKEIAVGTHVYVAEGSNRPIVPTGELYIVFQPDADPEEQQLVLEEFHLELVERRDVDRLIARVTPASPNPIKVAAALQKSSLVKHAEPDLDTLLDEYNFQVPSDNLLTHEWHLQNMGRIPDVNYPTRKGADAHVVDAWKRLGNLGSDKITVAIIDNGFDLTHPDLRDKVVHPWDFWSNTPKIPEGDPAFTHATPVASLAVASANGSGLVGVAPRARLMPLNGTNFSLRFTEAAFQYCIEKGADIISCSWGTTDPRFTLNPLKEEAIARAAREGRKGRGCVILFAAGNEGFDYVNFYAAHPDVICVGASDSRDRHAPYSNRGLEVSVCAPSNGDWPIIAARAWWDPGTESRGPGEFRWWADGRSRGDNYKHFGGTSAATPIVAGICALMLSANPELSAAEVKEILQMTADKIGDPSEYDARGHSRKYGYGRVNADRAVAEALRRRAQPLPADEVSGAIRAGRGLFRFAVEKQAPQGWAVQVGVFAEYGNVLIQAEKLRTRYGEPVLVNINELEGRTVYKVLVGPFSEKKSASELLKRIKKDGGKGFVRNLADFA